MTREKLKEGLALIEQIDQLQEVIRGLRSEEKILNKYSLSGLYAKVEVLKEVPSETIVLFEVSPKAAKELLQDQISQKEKYMTQLMEKFKNL